MPELLPPPLKEESLRSAFLAFIETGIAYINTRAGLLEVNFKKKTTKLIAPEKVPPGGWNRDFAALTTMTEVLVQTEDMKGVKGTDELRLQAVNFIGALVEKIGAEVTATKKAA
jgi:hypothetical protein